MTEQHPITPPPELVQQLAEEPGTWLEKIVNAYRAGADQELQACCEWLDYHYPSVNCGALRAARRPKSPNKKQRGLTALEATNLKKDDPLLYQEILNAIEGLPND